MANQEELDFPEEAPARDGDHYVRRAAVQYFFVGAVAAAITLLFVELGFVEFRGSIYAVGFSYFLSFTGALSLVTWFLIWVYVLIVDPVWAFMSLFMPPLVYRYSVSDSFEIRRIVPIHFGAVFLWVLMFMGGVILAPYGNEPGEDRFERFRNQNFDLPELPDDLMIE